MLITIFLAILGIGIISAFMKLCFGVGWLTCKIIKYGSIILLILLIIAAALK